MIPVLLSADPEGGGLEFETLDAMSSLESLKSLPSEAGVDPPPSVGSDERRILASGSSLNPVVDPGVEEPPPLRSFAPPGSPLVESEG